MTRDETYLLLIRTTGGGMKLSTTVCLIALIATTMTGCSSLKRNLSNFFFPPNPFSDRREGEQVTLDLEYKVDRNTIKTPYADATRAGVAAVVAPIIAGYLFNEASDFLKTEAERYSATYSATAFGDTFYTGFAPESPINLKGLILKRTVKNQPALEFCAAVEPTLDQRAFQLIPLFLSLDLAKAKLIAFDWLAPLNFDLLAPWTVFKNEWFAYDNDVDVKIELSLSGIWTTTAPDGAVKVNNDVLAKQEFSFQNVSLSEKGKRTFIPVYVVKKDDSGQELKHDWAKNLKDTKPVDKPSCEASLNSFFAYKDRNIKQTVDGVEVEIEPLKAIQVSIAKMRASAPVFPAMPRSFMFKIPTEECGAKDAGKATCWGTGNFAAKALVTEYDHYGERIKDLKSKLDDKKDTVMKQITGAFD